MNTPSMETGRLALFETIQSGGDLAAHMRQMFAHTQGSSGEVLGGTLSGLLEVYAVIRKSGCRFNFEDPELDNFMQAGPHSQSAALTQKVNAWEVTWLETRVSALLTVIHHNRHLFNFNEKAAQAATPAQPLEVRVVGMPERVRESSVDYDEDGNVKSTTQVEKDATPA